jgi:tetratricopeptide (TPR) repeat protein
MSKLSALRTAAFLFSIYTSCSVNAQGITTPRTPSPAATVSQTIGISTVSVKYSRPSVKGREVWGNLVPYGYTSQTFGNQNEAPWRAGANENSVIKFSHDAKLEGQPVPAGEYGLFFVVNKDNTGEVVLSKDHRSWGSFWYEPQHDLLRAKIQLRDIAHTEMLTYDFVNATKTSAELTLNWEKKQFPVKIEFAVDDIVIANATEELKGPVGFTWQGYSSAANYTLLNKVNYEQGLKWIDQAIAQNKIFTTLNIKAGLLKATGKTEEAEKIITEAVALANENELNIYGYQLLNQDEKDKAIEILALNTKRFPRSANAWDSLGEAYALKGDKKNAIANFKKSLSLNPTALTKANSEKYLKQLGAL